MQAKEEGKEMMEMVENEETIRRGEVISVNEVKAVEEKVNKLNSITRVEPVSGLCLPAVSYWWGHEAGRKVRLEQLYRSLRRCPSIPPHLSQFVQYNNLLL